MVSTLSGAIFAFGANSSGQLGITKTEDRFFPTEIKSLRKQRIAPAGIAAGLEHSLALTEEGGVFSWGSNRYGQLGRRSAQENFDATPTRYCNRGIFLFFLLLPPPYFLFANI